MNFITSILNPAPVPQAPSLAPLGLGGAASLTGGETRPDGRVSYGFSLLRGKRPNMEDFHHAQFRLDPKTNDVIGLFGVFDGHGGPNAADYVRSNLFMNMLQSSKYPRDVAAALREAYEATDLQYLQQESAQNRDDGCTAVTALLLGSRLYIANVGDSRAVLCRGGKAIALSTDHKPNTKEERERIEAAGGVIVWAGTWRVGGVLAVSRAFGDRALKHYVISTPDVRDEALTTDDELLLLASDGLFDVMTNQDAVQLVRDIKDPKKAAKKLTDEALQRGSNDNISCIVVRFK